MILFHFVKDGDAREFFLLHLSSVGAKNSENLSKSGRLMTNFFAAKETAGKVVSGDGVLMELFEQIRQVCGQFLLVF